MDVLPPTQIHWKQDLRATLKLIGENSFLIGGGIVFLSAVSLFYYIQIEHVPLNLASSDVFAALPVLFATVSLLTIVLTLVPLLPVAIMFDGVSRGNEGILLALPSNKKSRKAFILWWLAALTLPGLVLTGALAVYVRIKPNEVGTNLIMWTALLASCGLFTLSIWKAHKKRKRTLDAYTTIQAAALSFTQILLFVIAMRWIMGYIKPQELWQDILLSLSVVVTVSLLQIFFVLIIVATSNRGSLLMQALVGATAIVIATCLFPFSGGKLAGYVLRTSAMGGRSCVQLTLARDASDIADLVLTQNGIKTTPPLTLLAQSEQVYLARRHDKGQDDVYRIPVEHVQKIGACPKR